MVNLREFKRDLRHERSRKKLGGTPERPRMCIRRTLNNLHVQIIDDATGKILLGRSTNSKSLRSSIKSGGNVAGATALGEKFAKEALNQGIKQVCFDRCGHAYHGRIKAFAEAARKSGLEF